VEKEGINIIVKVDQNAGGIKDYTEQLVRLDHKLREENKIRKEKKGSIIIYQIGNSSRKMLVDFLINKDCIRVIELHDLLARNKYLRIIYPIILNFFLKKADAIILHSEHAKIMFNRLYNPRKDKRIGIIPLLIFKCENLTKEESKVSLTKFLMIGHIKRSKGLSFILKAFSDIQKRGILNYELTIAGKINEDSLKLLNRYRNNRMKIINKFLSDKEFNELMSNTDFVFNYKVEDLGESSAILSKALYLKKPTISSYLGSNIELLSESSLISKIGVNYLIDKIILAITRKKEVINSEVKLINKIRNKLSDNNIIKGYYKIIGEITKDEKN
jgi:glycosyltransferase involved in cell wall biosynthesis